MFVVYSVLFVFYTSSIMYNTSIVKNLWILLFGKTIIG